MAIRILLLHDIAAAYEPDCAAALPLDTTVKVSPLRRDLMNVSSQLGRSSAFKDLSQSGNKDTYSVHVVGLCNEIGESICHDMLVLMN